MFISCQIISNCKQNQIQPIREMLRIVHDHDKALMDEILDFEKELANDISRSMKVYTFKVCAVS